MLFHFNFFAFNYFRVFRDMNLFQLKVLWHYANLNLVLLTVEITHAAAVNGFKNVTYSALGSLIC